MPACSRRWRGRTPRPPRAFVEDVLSIAGISSVGGRTAGDIAERFLARAAERENPVNEDVKALLAQALADHRRSRHGVRQPARAGRARLARSRPRARRLRRAHRLPRRARRRCDADRLPRPPSPAISTTTPASSSSCTIPARPDGKPVAGGGRYDHVLGRLGAAGADPRRRRLALARPADGRRGMNQPNRDDAPLVLAVPSKGRLQENATAFFGRAGLKFVSRAARATIAARSPASRAPRSRSSRPPRSSRSSPPARRISASPARIWCASRCADADAAVEMLTPLGFGHANVVVAVPQAWIDVRTMADLDDVASTMRARQGRKLRVATKYVNLTRRFFAEHGLADYRIVESLGATEGAPAAGTAEIVVDITTTGSTLSANALKVLDDGVMLASEANLVASVRAPWGERARSGRPRPSCRASRPRRKRARCAKSGCERSEARPRRLEAMCRPLRRAAALRRRAARRRCRSIHCPDKAVFALVEHLAEAGADDITVAAPAYVFRKANPLIERLFARI